MKKEMLISDKALELIATGRANYIGPQDCKNTDCLDELLNCQTIIEENTELEAYFNSNGVNSNSGNGYSRFIRITKSITFDELLNKLEKESGLSLMNEEISFIGNGNADTDTKFELI